MKKIIYITYILIFTTSCSNFLTVQKRRYLPGYYVDVSNHHHAPQKKDLIQVSARNSSFDQHKKQISPEPKQNLAAYGRQTFSQNEPAQQPISVYLVNNARKPWKSIPQKHPSATTLSFAKEWNETGGFVRMPIASKRTMIEKNLGSNSDGLFLGLSGIFAALAMGSLFPLFSKPSKLSFWAKNNKRKTRGLILAAHFVIGSTAFYLGHKLKDFGITTTSFLTDVLMCLSALTVLLFPMRNRTAGLFKSTFFKQRSFSVALNLLGFLLMVSVGNRQAAGDSFSTHYSSIVPASFKGPPVSAYHVTDELSQAGAPDKIHRTAEEIIGNIFITIALIALLFVLLYLIAYASCALSCNGQEALAVVVLIGGGSGALYLFVLALRGVWKPRH